MRFQRVLMRRAAGPGAVLVLGLVAANAALAAPSMSHVDWHLNADWPSWLLGGAVVLLVVALILRAVKVANSLARDSDPDDPTMETRKLYTQRLRTAPIASAERRINTSR